MLALFPEITQKAQAGDLETLAVLIRSYFGAAGGKSPKLSASDVVRAFGIPVGEVPIHYYGAIAVKDEAGEIKASMIIKENMSAAQRSFVLCHLLGHFLFHIQPILARSEWKTSGFKELQDPMRRYAYGDGLEGLNAQAFNIEDLADRFAGALLMPAAMLRRAVEKIGELEKVALIFGVERDVVERRLDDIGSRAGHGSDAKTGARSSSPVDVLNQLAHSGETPRGFSTEQLVHEVDQPVAAMSRAVAAHSYQDTSSHGVPSPGVATAQSQAGSSRLSGMDRIREIARKMDKFSERDKS
jgi:Zn-dependent peptidase ImmA (M78 family)